MVTEFSMFNFTIPAMRLMELLEKGKAAQIGEVRDWKGKKYRKVSKDAWEQVKEGHKAGESFHGEEHADTKAHGAAGYKDTHGSTTAGLRFLLKREGSKAHLKVVHNASGKVLAEGNAGHWGNTHHIYDHLNHMLGKYNWKQPLEGLHNDITKNPEMRDAVNHIHANIDKWGSRSQAPTLQGAGKGSANAPKKAAGKGGEAAPAQAADKEAPAKPEGGISESVKSVIGQFITKHGKQAVLDKLNADIEEAQGGIKEHEEYGNAEEAALYRENLTELNKRKAYVEGLPDSKPAAEKGVAALPQPPAKDVARLEARTFNKGDTVTIRGKEGKFTVVGEAMGNVQLLPAGASRGQQHINVGKRFIDEQGGQSDKPAAAEAPAKPKADKPAAKEAASTAGKRIPDISKITSLDGLRIASEMMGMSVTFEFKRNGDGTYDSISHKGGETQTHTFDSVSHVLKTLKMTEKSAHAKQRPFEVINGTGAPLERDAHDYLNALMPSMHDKDASEFTDHLISQSKFTGGGAFNTPHGRKMLREILTKQGITSDKKGDHEKTAHMLEQFHEKHKGAHADVAAKKEKAIRNEQAAMIKQGRATLQQLKGNDSAKLDKKGWQDLHSALGHHGSTDAHSSLREFMGNKTAISHYAKDLGLSGDKFTVGDLKMLHGLHVQHSDNGDEAHGSDAITDVNTAAVHKDWTNYRNAQAAKHTKDLGL
jgi:hypothetical protein